ncbi:hypothetical protein ASPZODRAFT_134878 [Penicilliopsis zonata CBS 506.65]|uniref:Uncharacterized protein n=1 Tax=Penicilliopsis zonata CBS 506.65 TaxID=1073090 RepID=A0A1L9SC87_9EURO|nr:hypothetical protein ASPZODRAFT_134878 [Penicilliopsis zonata CBS 506.65]OJJ44759.1 hypothetical protein ASPZODRAFT_134878 [Penicilliopsis zonata CBS 506.65]
MTTPKKVLGRSAGSINAPIAAFTMAVLLCSYCFSSIRTARREAEHASPTTTRDRPSARSDSWIADALEESRKGGNKGA